MKIIVISGTSAGIGKTTLSIGLMAALEQRGLRVQAFKVGPDFNDPLRHEQAINRPSHSLDGTMLTKEYNISTVAKFSSECDVAIVDGLDGLFDGYDPNSENGSTAQMAKWLKAPVILVCDCDSMARSIAAVTRGYQEFDTELTIAGVVFNKVGSLKHETIIGIDEIVKCKCGHVWSGPKGHKLTRYEWEPSRLHHRLTSMVDSTISTIIIPRVHSPAMDPRRHHLRRRISKIHQCRITTTIITTIT